MAFVKSSSCISKLQNLVHFQNFQHYFVGKFIPTEGHFWSMCDIRKSSCTHQVGFCKIRHKVEIMCFKDTKCSLIKDRTFLTTAEWPFSTAYSPTDEACQAVATISVLEGMIIKQFFCQRNLRMFCQLNLKNTPLNQNNWILEVWRLEYVQMLANLERVLTLTTSDQLNSRSLTFDVLKRILSRVLTLTTNGPPLSPSHESRPVRPAHRNWL